MTPEFPQVQPVLLLTPQLDICSLPDLTIQFPEPIEIEAVVQ